MQHRTTRRFWKLLYELPEAVQDTAQKKFRLLKNDPSHPSLQFKKVGKFWSARVDLNHRVLAVRDGDDYIWVWIGTHDEYDRIIS